MRCIYCQEEIDKTNASIEDIIPDSLTKGERLRSGKIVCAACNGELGRQVDVAITDWLPCKLARCVLRLVGKKGVLPAVEFLAPNGARITLDPELNPVVKTTSTRISGDASSAFYKVIAGTYAEGKAEADRIVRVKTRRVEETQEVVPVRSKITTTRHKHDPPLVNKTESYDARLLSRAVTKIAFEYLATKVPRAVVLTGQFSEARHFIRYYKISQGTMLCQATNARLPLAVDDPFFHRVSCFSSSKTGHAWGLVELFGHLRWFVPLTTRYQGPKVAYSMTLHPSSGKGMMEKELSLCSKILRPIHIYQMTSPNWESVVDDCQIESLVFALHVHVYRKMIDRALPQLVQTLSETANGVSSITWARRLVSRFCETERPGRAALCFISENLVEYFAHKTVGILGKENQSFYGRNMTHGLQRRLQEAFDEASRRSQT